MATIVTRASKGTTLSWAEMDANLNNLNDKVSEVVSVKDFGAVGDGVTNDTTAFEALVTHCASTGKSGFLPAGTYLINPSIRTFSNNRPFIIFGEGAGLSILKNSNTSSSFIYWTGANNVGFEDLTIDGSFTGLPSVPVSGATLCFENSNNNSLCKVDFQNIYRIACLIYNDHQTTLGNVYGGHRIDNCRIFGPTNAIANVGPSGFLLADVNDSAITDCYIEKLGQYGYEFKNDCSRTLISDCIAKDTYYPFYYGGDGVNISLGYVKNSIIDDCSVIRATSGTALTLGRASNNTISNLNIDTTGPAVNFPIYITNSSNNNIVKGISLKDRNYEAVTVRNGSNNNFVEFINIIDGAYTGRGSTGIGSDCSGNTLVFECRDGTQLLFLNTYSFYNNTIIDKKYNNERLSSGGNALKRISFGDNGADTIPGAAAGLAVLGTTANTYLISAQNNIYQNVGSFSKHDSCYTRYTISTGTKLESLWNGTSYAGYYTDSTGFYPSENNTRKLGIVSAKWSEVNSTYVIATEVSSGILQLSSAATGTVGKTTIGGTTSTSVGAAGGAAALPATPLGYIVAYVGTTPVKIPYYN